MRFRVLPTLAISVCATLVLSGCVPSAEPSASDPIDEHAASLVADLRDLPFDDGSIEIVTEQLGAAGVSISEAWDDTETAIVRTTPWQVQNMAAEAANGGGVSGAELESMSATPEGAPPIGYLISAWAISFDSDGARFAHALLGDQDFHHPESILFPSLVTTLFLADATADYDATDFPVADAAGTTTVSSAAMVTETAGSEVCAVVANFIQRAIATVVNALKVDTSGGGFFGFIGKIWNKAVDLAAGLIKGLIEVVTRPVVQLITTIFGVLETIRQVSTYLVAWRSTLVPKPDTNVFGVDGAVIHGRVTLTVLDNRIPIPDEVLACSDAFDVNLRDAGSATGSAVSWDATNMARPDLSRLDTAEDVLDRNQIAQYDYLTGQETAKEAQGDEHAGLLKLVSSVHRNDIEKVRLLFRHLLFEQVPSSIRGIVESIAGPIVDAATNHLTSITDVRSTGYVAITFHSEPPPATTPSASPTKPPADASGECPTGLLAYLTATYSSSNLTVNSIAPAQFLADYAGVLPNLSRGVLPSCAFQLVSDVGIGHEFAYFVGADETLVAHARSVMIAAGYNEMAGTTGIYEDADGRTCAATYTPRDLAVLPGVDFQDQIVVIQGPQISSL